VTDDQLSTTAGSSFVRSFACAQDDNASADQSRMSGWSRSGIFQSTLP
jgi:hypothetical protein